MTESWEVVVVGGGAAGLSAALVLGRARRRTLVVDAGEPRNAPSAHMQGYLSRDGMSPAEFLAVGREETARYGVQLVRDRVVDATGGEGFTVVLASGRTVRARHGLGAEMRETPFGSYPVIDERGLTSVPGLWAAGNVSGFAEQVINAADRGHRAGAAINGDLLYTGLDKGTP
ncbi:FAD-binding protein [Streptomyces actinomycinicus]|uniref:FAD-binding protein n=1 Tax=Streptomyces actinomycinicus TaxID=1695166 RepID=A0A937JNY2_9ACTN|nr:FAD-binding protein [Streptomyces actinomycinicus]MBL1082887.1 FAD-binding protein [Streptomyces actinomycinicus]